MGSMSSAISTTAVGPVVHIIQVALTPVFLLTGIATLLNVFATRLARVADQVESLAKAILTAPHAEGRRRHPPPEPLCTTGRCCSTSQSCLAPRAGHRSA